MMREGPAQIKSKTRTGRIARLAKIFLDPWPFATQ
jgi:hypothetical protein